MELREYQKKTVENIKNKLKIKASYLLTAPCAAGKTVIFSHIAKWLHENNRRVLILMDREQLVSQTAEKIREYLDTPLPDPVGIVCATAGSKQDNAITVASRQSFESYLKKHPELKYNLVIIDECHLLNQEHGQYMNIITELKNRYPAIRLFGCTATPYRLSGLIYGDGKLWNRIDYQITQKELLEQSYLVPLRWKVRKQDKIDKLKAAKNGELNEAEQYEIVSQNYFLESVYDVWKDHCQDRKTVIYALNIAHAEAIGRLFQKMNIKTGVIHSNLSKSEITAKINEFDKVLINVGILTIGSDIPSISAIILARKTLSTALFFQITGRGARLSPGKADCLVIDLCGNALLHGIDPDNPILPDLKNSDEKKMKLCPECEEFIAYAARICPQCGFEFPIEDKKQSQEKEETTEAGKIEDFDGYETVECDRITYRYHKTAKPIPTVWVKFWNQNTELASVWLCPEHQGYPRQKANEFWHEMWGSDPPPQSVDEFLQRQRELSGKAILTIDITQKYPKVLEMKNNLF